MRKLVLVTAAAAVVAAAALQPANAEEYPWCAQYGFRGGGARNCGFVSYQQCMATVSGVGGFCERNSFYRAPTRRYRRSSER